MKRSLPQLLLAGPLNFQKYLRHLEFQHLETSCKCYSVGCCLLSKWRSSSKRSLTAAFWIHMYIQQILVRTWDYIKYEVVVGHFIISTTLQATNITSIQYLQSYNLLDVYWLVYDDRTRFFIQWNSWPIFHCEELIVFLPRSATIRMVWRVWWSHQCPHFQTLLWTSWNDNWQWYLCIDRHVFETLCRWDGSLIQWSILCGKTLGVSYHLSQIIFLWCLFAFFLLALDYNFVSITLTEDYLRK